MRYFANFPRISYSNNVSIDITRRTKVVDTSNSSPFVFHPYDITFHLRSDQVAEYYYNDSFLDWLIYISNDITDPFYDWYVRDDQLDDLISEKYGATETAKRKVKFYINNWYENAEAQITIDRYENTIAKDLKKYYNPHYSEDGQIMAYRRARVDYTMNTNRMIDYDVSAWTTGNSFQNGELVKIWQPGEQVGSAEAVTSNSSFLRIQSVSGNTFANSSTNTYIVGETSGSNVAVSSSNTVMVNISDEEDVFWSPMYFYDWEVMRNEQKKTIRLVDSSVVPFLTSDTLRKLNNL